MSIFTIFPPTSSDKFYIDKSFKGSVEEYKKILAKTKTIYVSNLRTTTEEEKIWALFGLCGDIRRVIVGKNRCTELPCGFCFVEFVDDDSVSNAMRFKGFKLDGNELVIDRDMGFKNERQFGRGFFGNQQKFDQKKRRKFVKVPVYKDKSSRYCD